MPIEAIMEFIKMLPTDTIIGIIGDTGELIIGLTAWYIYKKMKPKVYRTRLDNRFLYFILPRKL